MKKDKGGPMQSRFNKGYITTDKWQNYFNINANKKKNAFLFLGRSQAKYSKGIDMSSKFAL